MNETVPKDSCVIPAPPASMVEAIIGQMESGISAMPVPEYVKQSVDRLIVSLRRWVKESESCQTIS